MANIRTLEQSFGGGELTPEFFGRIGDAKFQSGLALCRNFITLPHGVAQNRSGFAYVNEVQNSLKRTRLINFSYSTTQTMVLEFGNQYIRFHTQGATLQTGAVTAWNSATAYTIGSLASSSGVNYYCIAANTNQVPPNATYWYALSGTTYEIPTPYLEADIFDLHYVESADVVTIVHPSYAPMELRRYGATNWQLATIGFVSSLAAPTGVSASASTGSGTTYYYKVTAVGQDGLEESLASTPASCNGNLLTTNAINTISWTAVTGAKRYNIYKQANGALYGYIGQSDSTSFQDQNITANIGQTAPEANNPFPGANDYPGAVSYYEQRRCFAGTNNKPQNVFMTRSGTESNMSYSLPIRDDDSINFKVAAREANTIRHIVPLTKLILLTSSAEWSITSINSDALTPTSISVKPQSYIGASNVQPCIINNTLIYAAARGGHLRELAYNWQANGYITGDLSLRAPHLFDTFTIVDMAYAKAPQPILWSVSSTGKLIGLTYVPEQQVGAFHQHDTDGSFESVTVVAEGNDDVLYAVVKRTINGAQKRFIERMRTRTFTDPADAFFVDCGATFDATNTSTTTVTVTGGTKWDSTELLTITSSAALFQYPAITDVNDAIVFSDSAGVHYRLTIMATSSTTVATAKVDQVLPVAYRGAAQLAYAFARDSVGGLTWLEGKTVAILADGAVMPKQVVAGGVVQLARASSKVQIGLPITADLQTLPWSAQIDAAFGQGRTKNVNKVWLRVNKSSGIFVGFDADHLTEAKLRTTENYGAPPSLKTQEVLVPISPSWTDSGQVFIRQNDPLPLTLISLTLEVSIGS